MTKTYQPMSLGAWASLVTVAAMWGGSFFFVALAVRDLPPFTIVLGRVLIGGVILGALVGLLGQHFPRERGSWLAFLVMGLLNNVVPFVLVTWAQNYIASGLAAILNATMPLFTILVAHVFTHDERLTGSKLAGIGIGLCGVAVLIGVDVLSNFGVEVWAQLAVLAASLCWGFGLVYGRRMHNLPPMVVATGQLYASTLLMLPLSLLIERPWLLPMPGIEAISGVLALALLSTVLAYTLFFRILATSGATSASLVTFLNPIFALLLGMIVLGERLAPNHFAGMALIFAGLAAIDGRLFRVFRRVTA
jgi:drug/metabolite transporter (DMT)-like permease